MDSVTHIVLGACIGEAMLGKKSGKKAMIWGALAASTPDIDALVNFVVTDIDSLLLHRAFTHSIFAALLAGPLWGWGLWKLYRENVSTKNTWMIMITLNILIHDLVDTCTVYGTGLFIPISDYRYSFDNIFVADPLYTLPLLIAFIVLVILKRGHPARYKWNRFGLITSSAYMLLTFFNHHRAVNALELAMEERGIKSEAYFAAPTLLNNLLWNTVAHDSAGFWIGYYSVLDRKNSLELYYTPKNEELLKEWLKSPDVQKLIRFSQGYYCISESDGKIWFNDLRFGQIGGWEKPDAPFAFSFDLSADADNAMVVQKGRIEGTKREMIHSLWNRMWGFSVTRYEKPLNKP
jgi:inner membrane protein